MTVCDSVIHTYDVCLSLSLFLMLRRCHFFSFFLVFLPPHLPCLSPPHFFVFFPSSSPPPLFFSSSSSSSMQPRARARVEAAGAQRGARPPGTLGTSSAICMHVHVFQRAQPVSTSGFVCGWVGEGFHSSIFFIYLFFSFRFVSTATTLASTA